MRSVTFLLAYLDPGSGSLILQVVIATILAVPFFLRSQIRRVVGKVRRALRGTGKPTEDNLHRD